MAGILIQQYLVNNFKRREILKKKLSGGNFDSRVYDWNEMYNRRTLRNRKQKNRVLISFQIVVMSLSDNVNHMFYSAILKKQLKKVYLSRTRKDIFL